MVVVRKLRCSDYDVLGAYNCVPPDTAAVAQAVTSF